MLGYSQEELLARSYHELMPPEDVPRAQHFIDQIWAGHNDAATYELEKRLLRKDGGTLWAIATVALVRDSSGTPEYVVSMIRDVTEHRKAQEALKDSEYRLDLALETSSLAVWDYNIVTGEVRLSRHWWPILGYTPGELPLRIEA
jgi:PAS domain S-box-containing protein